MPATDRYALGLVAYRLIVGESYYRGAVMSILAELLHGATIAPSTRDPSLGPAFDAWFLQACHRDPECRFPSATQQIEALAEALGLPAERREGRGDRPSSAPPGADGSLAPPAAAVVRPSPPSGPTRRRALAGGALLLAASAAALAYVAGKRGANVVPRATEGVTPVPAASPAPTERRRELVPSPVNAVPSAGEPTPRTTPSATGARSVTSRLRPRSTHSAPGVPSAAARDPFEDQK